MRILLLPLFASLLLGQQNERAIIISAGKGWLLGGRLAARGSSVNQGEILKGNSSAGDLVVDCEPQGDWFSYSCQTGQPCEVPACHQAPPGAETRKLGFLRWVNEAYLRREPKEVVTLGVRSGGNPTDSVLLTNAKGVRWGPALSRVIEGRYCLRLSPLPQTARASAQIFPVAWDRETDPEGIAAAPSLMPGLYILDKGTPGDGGACAVEPDEVAAWVVIAAEARFAQMNAQWKENNARLAQLERSGASPAVMTDLRHAILAALADGVTPP